ncbi:MAG: hypothetical protein ABJB93_10235 [Gaiellales bacterium]
MPGSAGQVTDQWLVAVRPWTAGFEQDDVDSGIAQREGDGDAGGTAADHAHRGRRGTVC